VENLLYTILMKKTYRKVFSMLFMGLVAMYLSILFYVDTHALIDSKRKSDAIVILGAKVMNGGKINGCFLSRFHHDIELYKKGFSKIIIFSGGDHQAETMKGLALSEGIPKDAILTDTTSLSTYENLVQTKEILEKNQLRSIIIVTDPYHE